MERDQENPEKKKRRRSRARREKGENIKDIAWNVMQRVRADWDESARKGEGRPGAVQRSDGDA